MSNVRPGFFNASGPARTQFGRFAVSGVLRLHNPGLLAAFQQRSQGLPPGSVRGVFVHPHPSVLPALMVRGFGPCCPLSVEKAGESQDAGKMDSGDDAGDALLGVANSVFKARVTHEARQTAGFGGRTSSPSGSSSPSTASSLARDAKSLHSVGQGAETGATSGSMQEAAARLGAIHFETGEGLGKTDAATSAGAWLGASAGHLSGWAEAAVNAGAAAARALQCNQYGVPWIRASRYSTPESERGMALRSDAADGAETSDGTTRNALQGAPSSSFWPPAGALDWAHPGMRTNAPAGTKAGNRATSRREAALKALGQRAHVLEREARRDAQTHAFAAREAGTGAGAGAGRFGPMPPLLSAVHPAAHHAADSSGRPSTVDDQHHQLQQNLSISPPGDAIRVAVLCRSIIPGVVHAGPGQEWKARLEGKPADDGGDPSGALGGEQLPDFTAEELKRVSQACQQEVRRHGREEAVRQAPVAYSQGRGEFAFFHPEQLLPEFVILYRTLGHEQAGEIVGDGASSSASCQHLPIHLDPSVGKGASIPPQEGGLEERAASATRSGELPWREAGKVRLPAVDLDLDSDELLSLLEEQSDAEGDQGPTTDLSISSATALKQVAAALAALPLAPAASTPRAALQEEALPDVIGKELRAALMNAQVILQSPGGVQRSDSIVRKPPPVAGRLAAYHTPYSSQASAQALLRELIQLARQGGLGPGRIGLTEHATGPIAAASRLAQHQPEVEHGIHEALEGALLAMMPQVRAQGGSETVGNLRASAAASAVIEAIAAMAQDRHARATTVSGAVLHAIQTIERVSIRTPGSHVAPGWNYRRDEVIHAARLLPAKALLGGESWDAGVMGLVTAVQGALKCVQGDVKLGKGQTVAAAAASVKRADWQGGHRAGRGSHALALGLVAAKGLARPGILRQEQLQLLQDRASSASLRMRLRSGGKPIPSNALQEHRVSDGAPPSARASTDANGIGPSSGLAGDGQATPIVSPGSSPAAGSQRPRPVALPAGMQLRGSNGPSPAVSPMVAGRGGARPLLVGVDGDGAGEGKDNEEGSGEEEEAPDDGGSPGGARQSGDGAPHRGGRGSSSPRGDGGPGTQAGPVPTRSGGGAGRPGGHAAAGSRAVGLGLGRRANRAAIAGGAQLLSSRPGSGLRTGQLTRGSSGRSTGSTKSRRGRI